MKKGKNITLLIGIICIAVQLLFAIFQLLNKVFCYNPGEGLESLRFYVIQSSLIDVVSSVILICFPLILLFRNFKNKSGKVLPIISIVLNCILLCRIVLSVIANIRKIPSYIILAKLGLIDTYQILLSVNLFFLVVGLLLTIIGSALSLLKKKEQTGINEEVTSN